MEIIANSRKLNGISLVECLQNDVKEKESRQFLSQDIVNQALVDKYNHGGYLHMDTNNPVSKSLKSFFRKLRGSAVTPKSSYEYNKSLTSPTTVTSIIHAEKRLAIPVPSTSRSLNSKYEPLSVIVKPKKTISKSTRNYHLPTIVTTATALNDRRRIAHHRHTLDLTTCNLNLEMDSGVVTHNSSRRRTNSLFNKNSNNNTSSIYSTFATTQKDISSNTSSSISDSSNISSTASSHRSTSSISTTSFSSSSAADDDSSIFITSCIKRTNNTVPNLTELLTNDSDITIDNDTDDELQKKLWSEDASICPKEEIAQWLGSKPNTRSNVLHLYMKNFNFSNQRLDEAFRKLCCKLYLKGESQQLDRILEAFAVRYFECNPNSLLNCVDAVHAVTYSLLLLNTDLHVVSDWANKMTRNSFIKNTMETVQTLVFPHLVLDSDDFIKQRKRRASLVSHQSSIENCSSSLRLKRNGSVSPSIISFFDDTEANNSHTNTSSTIIQKLDVFKSNLSRKPSSIHENSSSNRLTRKQKAWLVDVEYLLKDMYTAVKSHRIDQAAAPINASNGIINHTVSSSSGDITVHRSRTLPKNERNLSKRQSLRRRRGRSVINTLDATTDYASKAKILPSLPAKDLKQGLVMRKHVMESTDKRARHRQWQLCYLVMNENEMIMYRPTHHLVSNQNNHSIKTKKRKSIMLWNQSICSLQNIISQGDMDDWKADEDQEPLGRLDMNHTYASAIPPPGWNGHRPHVFRVETADGGLWLFESVDMFAVQAWVEAANTTAARISKGPLTGAVSNIDYGWGAKWDNSTERFTTENIPIWYPPTPCMIKSALNLNDQYNDLESQIRDFNVQLNEHRELKLSLDKKFSSSRNPQMLNSMQALTNWDRKLHYILHELIKLKCYKENLHDYIRNTTFSSSLII